MHSENLSVKNKRTPTRHFKTIFCHFQKTDIQRSGVGLSRSKLRQIPFFESKFLPLFLELNNFSVI